MARHAAGNTPIEAIALSVVEDFRAGEDPGATIERLASAFDAREDGRPAGDPPVPAGCTGYRGPDGGIAHDNDTCPIHESEDQGSVILVEVEGRDDGAYLFADDAEAREFSEAVKANGGDTYATEAPIHSGDGARQLIAAERRSNQEETI